MSKPNSPKIEISNIDLNPHGEIGTEATIRFLSANFCALQQEMERIATENQDGANFLVTGKEPYSVARQAKNDSR